MNKVRETKKFLAAVMLSAGIYASFSILPANAAVATLTGIDISPASNGSYQITVKTDKEVSIDKYVTSGNKIVLGLKNTKPASFVNTVYNNASKIDHVIVQPVSDEEVRVFLQGTNISSSNVSLSTKVIPQQAFEPANVPVPVDQNSTNNNVVNNASVNTVNKTQPNTDALVNLEPQASQAPDDQETIVLDRPVDNYKPVATLDGEDLNSENSLQEAQDAMVESVSLKKLFSTNALDWLLRFLMLAVIMIGAYKLFTPKKKVKINISSERDKELELIRSFSKKQGLIGAGLKSSQQSPVRKPGYSSLSQYGIKEYQNSQIPPSGMAASAPKFKNEFNVPKPSIKNDTLLKSRSSNISTISKTARTPVSSRVRSSDVTSAKVNIDSKKFLETMAQIYERSGRADLAQGIQNNIKKPKVQV